jgi:CO/xanthine dehydrogenase FAD-binding subunit
VTVRVDPSDDIHASASYRKRLAGILTRRALSAAHGEISETVPA